MNGKGDKDNRTPDFKKRRENYDSIFRKKSEIEEKEVKKTEKDENLVDNADSSTTIEVL